MSLKVDACLRSFKFVIRSVTDTGLNSWKNNQYLPSQGFRSAIIGKVSKTGFLHMKTSPKGFSASKCGNWIFFIYLLYISLYFLIFYLFYSIFLYFTFYFILPYFFSYMIFVLFLYFVFLYVIFWNLNLVEINMIFEHEWNLFFCQDFVSRQKGGRI